MINHINKECNEKFTDEDLLEFLKDFYNKNNRVPVTRDFRNNPEFPSYFTYKMRFGSWENALIEANLYELKIKKERFERTSLINQKDRNYSVYIHISPNEKYYIGITSKEIPEYRWNNGKGYPHNKHFTSAIEKYGWKNFQHEIIASNLTKEEACNFEILLIDKLNTTNPKKGYNYSSGGTCGNAYAGKTEEEMLEIRKKLSQANIGENNYWYGRQFSEEHRRKLSENHADMSGENNPMWGKPLSKEHKNKLSEAMMGKYNGENNPNAKAVILLNTGETFPTIMEAEMKYDVCQSNITYCCQGKRKSAGKLPDGEKLVWRYYYDDLYNMNINEKCI